MEVVKQAADSTSAPLDPSWRESPQRVADRHINRKSRPAHSRPSPCTRTPCTDASRGTAIALASISSTFHSKRGGASMKKVLGVVMALLLCLGVAGAWAEEV